MAMIIENAYWEKRNLNVKAISFHIQPEDILDEIIPLILERNEEYQTAIIDPARTDILLELQNYGFKFIECSITLSGTADNVNIPNNLRRFQNQMAYRPASTDEVEMIKEIIKNEHIFTTDKIALDPLFGKSKSGTRYSFWIDDLIASGCSLFVITFNEEVIGFEVAKLTDGTVEGFLGGMLPSKLGKMLGAAIYVPGTVYWKNQGVKKFRAVVSSNNLPIIKIHESFGRNVTSCKYVLIKHQ